MIHALLQKIKLEMVLIAIIISCIATFADYVYQNFRRIETARFIHLLAVDLAEKSPVTLPHKDASFIKIPIRNNRGDPLIGHDKIGPKGVKMEGYSETHRTEIQVDLIDAKECEHMKPLMEDLQNRERLALAQSATCKEQHMSVMFWNGKK